MPTPTPYFNEFLVPDLFTEVDRITDDFGDCFLTNEVVDDITSDLAGITHRRVQMEVADVLRLMGYTKQATSRGGVRGNYWRVPEDGAISIETAWTSTVQASRARRERARDDVAVEVEALVAHLRPRASLRALLGPCGWKGGRPPNGMLDALGLCGWAVDPREADDDRLRGVDKYWLWANAGALRVDESFPVVDDPTDYSEPDDVAWLAI